MKLLVTGALGNVSRTLLHRISDLSLNFETCATILPSAISHMPTLEHEHPGIDFKAVSYDNDDILDDLLAKTDILFMIPSSSKHRISQIEKLVESARLGQVRSLFLLSIIAADEDTNLWSLQYHEMETFVIESGIPYTIIRTCPFYETLHAFSSQISQGYLKLPVEEYSKFTLISVDDLCIMSTVLLSQFNLHQNTIYELTGPEILDPVSMCQEISRALEVNVEYEMCTRIECKRFMENQGMEPWLADGISSLFDMMEEGRFSRCEHGLFTDLLEIREETLEEFFVEHAEMFQRQGKLETRAEKELKVEKKLQKTQIAQILEKLEKVEVILDKIFEQRRQLFLEDCSE